MTSAARVATAGPHFFVEPADVDGDSAWLRGEDAHHLGAVLRARPGDPVSVADGTGAVWQGRVAAGASGAEGVRLELGQRCELPPARPALAVVHALPKGRKLDDVVRRLTEVGVDRIVPVHSERSEVRLAGDRAERAARRWRSVALAAAKQCRRATVPQVAAVTEWSEAFAAVGFGAVLWEQATTSLRAALGELDGADEVVLAVGPEGGLTAGEVAAAGLPAAGLGATVLRTETAALVAAAVVLAHLGRLG